MHAYGDDIGCIFAVCLEAQTLA